MIKNPPANAGDSGDEMQSLPWVRKIAGGGNGNPLTPVFLPGKFRGQKSLVGYSPWITKSQTQLSK